MGKFLSVWLRRTVQQKLPDSVYTSLVLAQVSFRIGSPLKWMSYSIDTLQELIPVVGTLSLMSHRLGEPIIIIIVCCVCVLKLNYHSTHRVGAVRTAGLTNGSFV